MSLIAVSCRCPNPAATVESTAAEPCPATTPRVDEAAGTSAGLTAAPDAPPAAGESGSVDAATGPAAPPPVAPSGEPLPEVRLRNVGLHIGGGPNDAATKAPFQIAIGAHFEEFRQCYPLVTNPGKVGVFGVDLRIPREGGQATVQSARTGMTGKAFRDCVLDVFSRVEFARPPQGPTVVSYSLEFSVGKD